MQPTHRKHQTYRQDRMSLFLSHFHKSFRYKFIFGACPFAVDNRNAKVICSRKVTIYTSILTLSLAAVYSRSMYKALICFEIDENTTTQNLNITIKHNVNFAVFVAFLSLSLRNRQRHVQLLNSLMVIYDRIHTINFRRNQSQPYSRLHVVNLLYVIAFFSCPITKICFLETNEVECVCDIIPFFILFGFIISNMLIVIVHIQDLVIVMCNIIDTHCDQCSLSERLTDETVCLLDDLYELTRRLSKCFGSHLLLTSLNEITIVANMLLINIRQIVFNDKCYTWYEVCFFSTFILPHIIKNIVQALVFERLERKMSKLEQFLLNEQHKQCVQMDMMYYKMMHNKNNKSITACGLFSMDSSTLFKVLTHFGGNMLKIIRLFLDDGHHCYVIDDIAAVSTMGNWTR